MDLKTLTELRGISGSEKPVRHYILEEVRALGLQPEIDRMGNVVVVKKGTGSQPKRVMVSAHMDEVGFIVRSATDEGFLRVSPMGGVDPRVVVSKRVLVGEEAIPGVIGAKAIHLQKAADRQQVLGYDQLYVDIGAATKEEAESKAPVGAQVTFDTEYVPFGDGFVSAKALDDRVGCYNLFRLLQGTYVNDLVAVFATQEEVGCRGAHGAAFAQEPDAGLILEGTTCNDLGDTPEVLQVCNAGQGVTVSFMDNASIANRSLFALAMRLGEEKNIPHQVKRSVSGGNEGGAVQRARGGVPTLVLSVPCRYIHSPSSVMKLSDVEAQLQLARAMMDAM